MLTVAAVLRAHQPSLRSLAAHEICTAIAGGARVDDVAADAAVAAALCSSLKDQPLSAATASFGEVGLTGQVC